MKRSRADVIARAAGAIAAAASVASACARFGVRGPPDDSAVAVVGDWIDVASGVGADTMIWQFSADGHRRVVVRHGGGETTRTADRWYASPARGTRPAELCFVRRAGRDGASCTEFMIDSADAAAPTRRLRLLADWARVGGQGRVLVALPAAVR